MELSALRLTQSIGYVGAGTVEYLYQPSTNSYYFLELNPRPGGPRSARGPPRDVPGVSRAAANRPATLFVAAGRGWPDWFGSG